MATKRTRILALLLVGACGRAHFASVDVGSDAAGSDASPDAAIDPIGCSDGGRDAFQSQAAFPGIAGCTATWMTEVSMRASRTGAVCGDDRGGACAAPADACSPGWELCGATDDVLDFDSNVTANECRNVGGAGESFVGAMNHCVDDALVCHYSGAYGCTDVAECSEPVCCGTGCETQQSCRDGLWLQGTTVAPGGPSNGCSGMPPGAITGVLCCRQPVEDVIGCADGSREAFVDRATYPRIAGCDAEWNGEHSMREVKSGGACGTVGLPCASPADACAVGWHICADNDDAAELTAKVSATACTSEGAAGELWIGAMNHCASDIADVCDYTTPFGCTDDIPCSEPVCCGRGCDHTEDCVDGIYPGNTGVGGGDQTNGCAGVQGGSVSGVLCCR